MPWSWLDKVSYKLGMASLKRTWLGGVGTVLIIFAMSSKIKWDDSWERRRQIPIMNLCNSFGSLIVVACSDWVLSTHPFIERNSQILGGCSLCPVLFRPFPYQLEQHTLPAKRPSMNLAGPNVFGQWGYSRYIRVHSHPAFLSEELEEPYTRILDYIRPIAQRLWRWPPLNKCLSAPEQTVYMR